MIEDLLAFAVIVAVWKIVQVWVLKRRVAQKVKEVDALKRELNYSEVLLETVTTFAEPEPIGKPGCWPR